MSSSTVHNVLSTPATPTSTDEQPSLKESLQYSLQPVDSLPFPALLLPHSPILSAKSTPNPQHFRSSIPKKPRGLPRIAGEATAVESLRPKSSPATHSQLCLRPPEPLPPFVSGFSNRPGTLRDDLELTEKSPASPSSPRGPSPGSSRQQVVRTAVAGVSEEMGNKASKIKATSQKQVAKPYALNGDHTLDVSANVSTQFPVPRIISAKDEGTKAEDQFTRPPENGSPASQRESSGSNATSTPSIKSYLVETLLLPNQLNEMGDMLVDVLNSAPAQTSNEHELDPPKLILTPSHTRPATSSSTISPGTITDRKPIAPNHAPQKSFASLIHSRPKSGHIIMDTPAPQLTVIHLKCYQFHKNIKESSNVHAPVPCMTCHVEDKEMRWKCTWCCLRVCDKCMETLDGVPDRDLKGMLAVKEKQRTKNKTGLKAADKRHHVVRSI